MALLGLKMALIHPKKVQIGYKLDQNTNLVNTFENNRLKCKKVKIQWNMDDFHWKISIPGWKSLFVKNHEKRKNSLPDCPNHRITDFQLKKLILANFCWKSVIFCWKIKISKIWLRFLFWWLWGPTYPKMSQIGQSGKEFLRFSWFFTNPDFQHRMLIF